MLRYTLEPIKNQCKVRIESEACPRRVLYLDTLRQLSQEIDRVPLNFLIEMHLRSPNVSRAKETTPFQEILIPQERALEMIELLVRTKRLFFQKRKMEGDFSSKGAPFWEEKGGELHPFFRWKKEKIPFAECQMFPGWAIWREWVFPIETRLSWSFLEMFLGGATVLHGAKKKQFLEEQPEIIYETKEAKEPLATLPCLQLTDATGCFANLSMEYSDGTKAPFESSWEKDLLDSGFIRKSVGRSSYYCEGDKVHATLTFLLELGWKILSFQGKKILRQTEVHFDIQALKEKAQIQIHIGFQGKEALLQKQEKSLWFDLDEKHVGLLDPSKWNMWVGSWEKEGFVTDIHTLFGMEKIPQEVRWDESLRKRVEEALCPTLALPSPLFQGTLLEYQQKGVNFLNWLYVSGFSGLLGDEMGLGKTVQVLAFFSRVGTKLPLLVIAPSSLLYQWEQEIRKFLPTLSTYLHVGPSRLKDLSHVQGVIITSYAILRLDEELLSRSSFEVCVLDESNAIKTSSTATSAAARRIQARCKIALTGTPVENRMEELISQFQFLMPSLSLKKLSVQRLRLQVRPFLLRRTKEDVALELPEKREQTSWVEMNEEQEALYTSYLEQMKKGILQKVEREGLSSHRMEAFEAILRLRQICIDPRLVGESAKGAKLDLLLEEIGDRKVLIFSQFTKMLDLVAQELEDRGIRFVTLDGSLSLSQRASRVDAFQTDPSCLIFLISLKAGGVGLNLSAAEAVFILDPWWNHAVEDQAVARAHRLGAQKSLLVKRYLTPRSIEEKMLRLKESKHQIAEQLLEDSASSLTEADLLHLLT